MNDKDYYIVIDLRKLPPRVYDSFSYLCKTAERPEDVICFYEKMAMFAVDLARERFK